MSVCHIMNMKMGDLANASARSCPEGAQCPRGVRMCMEQYGVRDVSELEWNTRHFEVRMCSGRSLGPRGVCDESRM
jgi:hypothetical protein